MERASEATYVYDNEGTGKEKNTAATDSQRKTEHENAAHHQSWDVSFVTLSITSNVVGSEATADAVEEVALPRVRVIDTPASRPAPLLALAMGGGT